VHPKVVQERLGHASITLTLDTYSHVLPTLQKDAASKLNLVFRSFSGCRLLQERSPQILVEKARMMETYNRCKNYRKRHLLKTARPRLVRVAPQRFAPR
jgi:hypothetical protein